MSKKVKITENKLITLGYVKSNDNKDYKVYSLDENIFNDEYGLNCDSIIETNVVVYANGECVMGGELEIEDFNDLRDVLYKTLYYNGVKA